MLTIPLILIAEVLIYVPSIANFRMNRLNDRLAALLAAKYPGKTAAWIAKRLRSRATKLTAMGAKTFTEEYGYGLLNLQKSL